MVAALGVSNITLSLPSTNGRPARPGKGRVCRLEVPEGLTVAKGEELGIFHLGSTVIVLFQNQRVDLTPLVSGKMIFMGEPIATGIRER
jgi:phosphatidylserine decarboxylase